VCIKPHCHLKLWFNSVILVRPNDLVIQLFMFSPSLQSMADFVEILVLDSNNWKCGSVPFIQIFTVSAMSNELKFHLIWFIFNSWHNVLRLWCFCTCIKGLHDFHTKCPKSTVYPNCPMCTLPCQFSTVHMILQKNVPDMQSNGFSGYFYCPVKGTVRSRTVWCIARMFDRHFELMCDSILSCKLPITIATQIRQLWCNKKDTQTFWGIQLIFSSLVKHF